MKHSKTDKEIFDFFVTANLILRYVYDEVTGEKIWLATTSSAEEIYYRPITQLQAIALCKVHKVEADIILKIEKG